MSLPAHIIRGPGIFMSDFCGKSCDVKFCWHVSARQLKFDPFLKLELERQARQALLWQLDEGRWAVRGKYSRDWCAVRTDEVRSKRDRCEAYKNKIPPVCGL